MIKRKVPTLRFKEFTGEWKENILYDLTNIFDGPHKTPIYTKKGISFISVENINDIYNSNKFISVNNYNKDFKIRPEKNDILMTRIGNIGTPALVNKEQPLAYYVTLALIKILNKKKIISNYLFQYIKCNNFIYELWKRTLHYAYPIKINKNEIGKCKISTPTTDEQKKIASFLSTVDEHIELYEKKLDNLQNTKKGYMQKIFNRELRFKDENGQAFPQWEEKKLGEICEIVTGNSNAQDAVKYGKYRFFDRGIDAIKYLNTYEFDNEAIIYAGEGKEFFPKYYYGKYALHQRCYSLFNASCVVKYLYYFMSTKSYHLLRYSVGSTVPSLRMESFKSCPINLPHLKEQQKIVNFLSTFDNQIDLTSEMLEHWKNVKKGLLQQMFV